MTAAVEVRRANTILYCDQFADTVTFYRDTLGLAVTYANDWFVEVHVAETAHLALADATRATIPASGGAGITLSWQVPDLDDARAALLERGIAVTDPSVRWNSTYVEFFDPEGTRIELWSPAP
ncbi:MAG: VOC family protein [Acidimicrobiales bacterium]|nr:VOC family protein [Acidimicrobiales bacterium]